MYIKRYPYSGTFELTGRCNLNCSMCYVHVNQKKIAELGERELTTEEWKRIADEVCDAGTFQLLLTGGEPLIRSDFAEIYTYIAQKGFFLTLYTNAVLLTDEIFEVLKKYPPHAIGVTIYGVTPETYEAVCGNGDAYYRMRKGLEKILTLPSRVELRTTITRQNVHEAEKLEAFIKGFGKRVTFNINHTIFRSGRNSIARPEEVRISPSENVSFYVNRFENLAKEVLDDPDKLSPLREDLEKAKAEVAAGCDDAKAEEPAGCESAIAEEPAGCESAKPEKPVEEAPKKGPFGCSAGWQDFTVSWSGKLLACQLTDKFSVDCKDKSFMEAWENLKQVLPEYELPDYCKTCKDLENCGVCPASRICETGSIDGKPGYFCQVAEEYSHLMHGRSGCINKHECN